MISMKKTQVKTKVKPKSKRGISLDKLPVAEETQLSVSEERKREEREAARQRQIDALKPFHYQPGQSGNPSGRPRDILKEIGQKIASSQAGATMTKKEKSFAKAMGIDPSIITLAEKLMLELATSKNVMKNSLFLERTFGKVPNINLNAEINVTLIQQFKNKLTDAELEEIGSGQSDVLTILLNKLPDVDDENIIDVKAEDG